MIDVKQHEENQKRYTATHATVQLIDAMCGVAPTPVVFPSTFERFEDKPACGETYRWAGRVFAHDPRPEVTCLKCVGLVKMAVARRNREDATR